MADVTQLSPDQFGELMLDLMKNKEKIIYELLGDLAAANKFESGLTAVIPSLGEDRGEANVRHQLKTAMTVIHRQNDTIRRLTLIALVQASSGDFNTQLAQVANKFGKGQEALQQMMREKLGGK